jgi:hypothetical protein
VKVSIHSRVEGGRLKSNRAALSCALADFEGKDVTITIARKKKTRSNEQNRFYWGALLPIVQAAFRDIGHILTQEETHLMLRAKFLNVALPIGEDGLFIDHIRSTTELSTTEFMEYIESIRWWCYENLGVTIPEPNEQTELDLNYEST